MLVFGGLDGDFVYEEGVGFGCFGGGFEGYLCWCIDFCVVGCYWDDFDVCGVGFEFLDVFEGFFEVIY